MKLMAFVLVVVGSTVARAGEFGVSAGVGLPYLSQVGLNYQMSDKLGFSAGYNLFDISSGTASVKLSMPEVLVQFHPFAGSYFIGAGVGMENLSVSSTSTVGTASADVEAITTIIKTGWMWGIANRGFWLGIDYAFIMPSNPKTTVTAPGVPTTSQEYQDVVDAGKKFGETSYGNLTFLRVGWLF